MGTYEKNHNLVILVPQVVIHATAGMTTWGHGNPVQHAGDSRLPRPVILAKAGIQYNMFGDSRSLFSLLDSRYDEKYGRWRSLFFYRSGMTTGGRKPLIILTGLALSIYRRAITKTTGYH